MFLVNPFYPVKGTVVDSQSNSQKGKSIWKMSMSQTSTEILWGFIVPMSLTHYKYTRA
jgi:hypothetical protein